MMTQQQINEAFLFILRFLLENRQDVSRIEISDQVTDLKDAILGVPKFPIPQKTIEKPTLYGLVRDDPKTPEGKYLVKRRDGSVVEWPHFVLGARDPAAPAALRTYAKEAQRLGTCSLPLCDRVNTYLVEEFDAYRKVHGDGDPGKGLHRKDDPATIAEMKKGHSS